MTILYRCACKPLTRFVVSGFLLLLTDVWLQAEGEEGVPNREPTSESSWLYHAWQTDDGLPNNDVTAVTQAYDGAMLFATQSGLARFDGWRLLEPADLPKTWNSRGIGGVMSSQDGTLWLATNMGLVAHRVGKEPQVVAQELGRDGRPNAFFEQADGTIWLSHEQAGVFRLRNGLLANVTSVSRPGNPPVRYSAQMVAQDERGAIWAAGREILARWQGDMFEWVADLPDAVTLLCKAKGGGLWIVSGRQLLRFTEAEGLKAVATLPIGPPGTRPSAILEDAHQRLWIGTFADGLYLREGSSFEKIPLSNYDVWSLCEDHESNLWAGTGGGGVCLVRPRVLETLREENAPILQTARSLCTDARGDIWVAMQTGQLYTRRSGSWRHLRAPANWPGPLATCVTADTLGNVWIGASENRVVRWDGDKYEIAPLPPAREGQLRIRAIMVARNGEIWIAQAESITHGEPGMWISLKLPPDAGEIHALAQDMDGRIWVGTRGSRLLLAQGDALLDRTPPGFPGDGGIRTILATDDGCLWVGTGGDGLVRVKEGRCSVLTTTHGLRHNVVSQLVLDHKGRLWGAGDRGIFLLSLDELNAVAEGRAERFHTMAFGASEGAPSLQANSGYAPNTMLASDNRLWFSSRSSGIVIANPELPGGNRAPPPVAIEDFVANGRTVPDGVPGPAEIGPGIISARFQLSAKSYTARENVVLQHRLSGVDAGWVTSGRDRIASYASLDPGSYVLRVRAMNNDGVWSKRDATLAFTVAPFLWQRTWFRAVAAIATLALAALVANALTSWRVHRQNVLLRQEVAVRRERARIARDVHDQIGASLTEISMLSDLAQADGAAPTSYLPRLARTARKAAAEMDEIVWAINPEHDNLASLLDYIGQQAMDLTGAAGVRCRLDFPDEIPTKHLTADFRHHLLLIVREAVNNTIKHASANEVHIEITPGDSELRVIVTDNGQGFEPGAVTTGGDGLANMNTRAKALRGTLQIRSKPGAGTSLVVHLPWPSDASPMTPAASNHP
ncbi:two component regulator with propeller domain [Roseimicrobium gellanilyticum]|uniref:Two component regulator with propeller domain n=1 Tax=Roseimicrobium gellanilyticum TaxID=748857 RepID=A0A366H7X2_9BACT|nr:sensor histidine kinase [Roseimicrobium gellanilyticum]RBP38156.1 two component regulator with propeller domain [Roseimicrobium gellanilyticum]